MPALILQRAEARLSEMVLTWQPARIRQSQRLGFCRPDSQIIDDPYLCLANFIADEAIA